MSREFSMCEENFPPEVPEEGEEVRFRLRDGVVLSAVVDCRAANSAGICFIHLRDTKEGHHLGYLEYSPSDKKCYYVTVEPKVPVQLA